jgi:hypothetical protein
MYIFNGSEPRADINLAYSQLKRTGKEESCVLIQNTTSALKWSNWGKPQKPSVKTYNAPAEI